MAALGDNDITTESFEASSGQLTNRQFVQLGRAISSPDMESIALGYLQFDEEIIKSLHYEHRGNAEAFNRDILRRWAYQNPGSDQVENLSHLLRAAATECGYVNPRKIQDILAVPFVINTGSQATEISEEEFLTMAGKIRPFTEQAMKIEVAPWIKDYVVDMDELYTKLTLEKIHNRLRGEETSVVKDYKELFDKCLAKQEMKPKSGLKEHISVDDSGEKEEDDSICLCFGKSKSKQTKKIKKLTDSRWIDLPYPSFPPTNKFTQSDTGEKILAKGDPGMGKTTWSKKIGWDWARGRFQAFSVVFFVLLKIVKPGATIENVIIEQNSYMKGLKIKDRMLQNILETFGNRCLLILDGIDEHALGTNQDVLKIIRGEKLLSCNIIVTSRPHSTKQIEKYFPVILRVEGFTYDKAKQFASKILSDSKEVAAVLNFNPADFRKDIPIYKCPILLSFLCLLVREDEIDLSTTDVHIGEIYFRMVRCLYKKFTIRKGIEYEDSGFKRTLQLIGKLAFETLLSGNPLLQRSKVISVAGHEAFDYGLLIGHEDAHRLIKDETADIFITFPHRSLQEFLGSFFFVQSLPNQCGDNMESMLGLAQQKPMFMVNPLFLKFCLWFLSSHKYQNLETSCGVYKSLQNYCIDRINNTQLDTKCVAEKFPALDISSALKAKDKLRLRFLRGIISNCAVISVISHLTVESSDVLHWVLNIMASTWKNVTYIKCNQTKVHLDYFPKNQVVVRVRKLCSAADLYVIIKQLKVRGLSVHLHLQNPSTLLDEGQVGNLSSSLVEYNFGEGYHSENDSIHYHPATHLCISNSTKFELKQLSQIVIKHCVWNISHLNFTNIKCGATNKNLGFLSLYHMLNLKHLNFLGTNLNEVDLRTLCFACNGKNKTLPKLTSLCLTISGHVGTKSVKENLFALPFLKLKKLYLHYSQRYHVDMDECLRDALSANKLPHLKCLGVQIKIEVTSVPLGGATFIAANHVQSLILCHCLLNHESSFFPMNLRNAQFWSCKGLSTYLVTLQSQGSPSLQTLALSKCDLNAQDLSCIAQASMAGRLPELKILDISRNKMTGSEVMHIFDHSCALRQLLSLDISRNMLDKNDVICFMERVKTDGLLCHLQELGIDTYANVDTPWLNLKTLYLPRCTIESLRVIMNDISLRLSPTLDTICIGKFEGYDDAALLSYMSRKNVHCHRTCAPFEDPFSSVRCYCQIK